MATACAVHPNQLPFRGRSNAQEFGVDFNAIYREHQRMVTGLVRMMVGPSDTEDVVQNVFLQIHRSLPRFRGDSKLKTWIYRIGVNVCLQHRRSRSRRKWLQLFRTETGIDEVGGESPTSELESRSALRVVEEALNALTDAKRAAYVLVEIQGLKPAQAAVILDTPPNTVRSRVLSARREVHEQLRTQGVIR